MQTKKFTKFFLQSGASLIEVLVATTVVALVLTSIAASMTMSLKTSSESKYRSFANFYSQEAMEFFKRERVKMGWADFQATLLSFSPNICLMDLPADLLDIASFSSSCEGKDEEFVNNEFTRTVSIRSEAADKIVLTVTVNWYDGNDQKELSLDGVFKEY
ncbi:MAG: hypothetical protein ABFQ62_01855 [Patescibacteria group bacterium]